MRSRDSILLMKFGAALVLTALAATGCGNAELKPEVTPDPRVLVEEGEAGAIDSSGVLKGTVTVWFDPVFESVSAQLRDGFVAQNPEATANIELKPSAAAADEIVAGATVDVFLSADAAAMAKVRDAAKISNRSQTIVKGGDDGAQYEIAVIEGTSQLITAQGFVGFLKSDAGQKIFADAGFAT